MPRSNYIDNIRGFAIILVIIGHSLQYCIGDGFSSNQLFRLIYSFHMPLFFLISGYVNGYSEKSVTLSKYLSKVRMLLIPFFVWSIINALYFRFSIDTYTDLLLQGYPYWFLWVIFMLITIFSASTKLESLTKVKNGTLYCLLIFYFASLFIRTSYLGLFWISNYLPYFIIGYILSKYGIVSKFHQNHRVIMKLVIAMASLFFLIFSRYGWQDNIAIPWFTINSYVAVYLWNHIVAISGIIFCFWIFSLKPFTKLFNFFGNYFGQITLEIYMIHYYYIFLSNKLLVACSLDWVYRVIICAILSLALSYVSVIIIDKIKPARFFLFGKSNNITSEKRS